jgi:hypothetical protein
MCFAISEREEVSPADTEMRLAILRESWNKQTPRQSMSDAEWTSKLSTYIGGLIDLRVNHVGLWLDSNLERFQVGHAAVEALRRRLDKMVIEMKKNVQLCRAQCASCHLLCVCSRLHEGGHSCETTHKCEHNCAFCEDQLTPCGIPCVVLVSVSVVADSKTAPHTRGGMCTWGRWLGDIVCSSARSCVVNAHLCGGPCKLSGKRGCLQDCTKVNHFAPLLVTCSLMSRWRDMQKMSTCVQR